MRIFNDASIAAKSLVAPLIGAVILVGVVGIFLITYRAMKIGNEVNLKVSAATALASDLSTNLQKGHILLSRAAGLKAQRVETKIVQTAKADATMSWKRAADAAAALDVQAN